ncbi:MAG: PA0069 family radical SAM protein [Planctomycetes bacterium]|nr:PA0069 family radical SAM protein [Planctomycetota bacterium]
MENEQRIHSKGRGSQIAPPNRFEQVHAEADLEYLEHDAEALEELRHHKTEFLPDASKSIISENDSPDIPFRYSLNCYRGCEHGCSYCYARPYHEYLGLNAGVDFETKIYVKHQAPELFRDWLADYKGEPEPIMFSGITDCYQPAERRFQLTRRCLEVACEARQPIGIVTKNALVTRDLDILSKMAAENTVHVFLSITTLDETLARSMEPRTSSPAARLRTIQQLREAGIPVGVMAAPIIPGLNDSEIPNILEAAREAGAQSAGYILLRLPLTVRPVFLEWLERTQPTKADRVESLVRSTRGGELNDPNFISRMRGSGQIAEQIRQTFKVFSRRYELNASLPPFETSHFRPPQPTSGQLRLF